jgi:hypothetical protein
MSFSKVEELKYVLRKKGGMEKANWWKSAGSGI